MKVFCSLLIMVLAGVFTLMTSTSLPVQKKREKDTDSTLLPLKSVNTF